MSKPVKGVRFVLLEYVQEFDCPRCGARVQHGDVGFYSAADHKVYCCRSCADAQNLEAVVYGSLRRVGRG